MVGGRSLGGKHRQVVELSETSIYDLSAFFKNSDLLNNPIVGVMIGVLVTVLVQVLPCLIFKMFCRCEK